MKSDEAKIQINTEVHNYVNNIFINASSLGATDLILAHPSMLGIVNPGLGVGKKKVKKKKKKLVDTDEYQQQ